MYLYQLNLKGFFMNVLHECFVNVLLSYWYLNSFSFTYNIDGFIFFFVVEGNLGHHYANLYKSHQAGGQKQVVFFILKIELSKSCIMQWELSYISFEIHVWCMWGYVLFLHWIWLWTIYTLTNFMDTCLLANICFI